MDKLVLGQSYPLPDCPANPTPTPTKPPTITVYLNSVGGIAELPEVAGTPLETADSSILGTGILAIVIASAAAGAVALGGAAWYAWYARRRFTRS